MEKKKLYTRCRSLRMPIMTGKGVHIKYLPAKPNQITPHEFVTFDTLEKTYECTCGVVNCEHIKKIENNLEIIRTINLP